jgi:hypothetical protein
MRRCAIPEQDRDAQHSPEPWDLDMSVFTLIGNCGHDEESHEKECVRIYSVKVCSKCHCLYVHYEN